MFAKSQSGIPKLKLLRLLRNLSQDELGLAIGLSGSYVSRIERGLVRIPPQVRVALVRVLGDAVESQEALPVLDLMKQARQEIS